MKRMIAALAAGGLLAMAGSASAAVNLITNGDFSAGNTGFTSQYNYVTPDTNAQGGALDPAGPTDGQGTYTVATNPSLQNSYWVNFNGTQNGNEGKMLIVNGASTGTPIVFSTAATLTGTLYSFSADVIDICCNAGFYSQFGNTADASSTVVFKYSLDGGTTYLPLTTAITGSGPGSAGSSQTVTGLIAVASPPKNLLIQVTNNFDQTSGNDFGLDNIVVTGAAPEPATWAFMIMGVAGMGLMLRRRQGLAVGSLAA